MVTYCCPLQYITNNVFQSQNTLDCHLQVTIIAQVSHSSTGAINSVPLTQIKLVAFGAWKVPIYCIKGRTNASATIAATNKKASKDTRLGSTAVSDTIVLRTHILEANWKAIPCATRLVKFLTAYLFSYAYLLA